MAAWQMRHRRGTPSLVGTMARSPATQTRRCSAGGRCASHAALGQPAKLSRNNPGPLCFACEERRAALELRKARRGPGAARGLAAETPPAPRGRPPRGVGAPPCAKSSCPRPAAGHRGGPLLCREHAAAERARRWQEKRARWAIACDANLREAIASGEEELARKWEGLLEEARARLAWAEADLAAAEAEAQAARDG